MRVTNYISDYVTCPRCDTDLCPKCYAELESVETVAASEESPAEYEYICPNCLGEPDCDDLED